MRKVKFSFSSALIIISVLTLTACEDRSDEAIAYRECLERLEDRLVSPSSFRLRGAYSTRIVRASVEMVESSPVYYDLREVIEIIGDRSVEEAIGEFSGIAEFLIEEYERDRDAAEQGELFLIRVSIPYESQNRFGVYLSGFAQCENFVRGSRQDVSESLNRPGYRAQLID
jgi:hypothetical protein